MIQVHAEIIGDRAVLQKSEFERLLEIARRVEPIEVRKDNDDIPASGIREIAASGGAFDWLNEEEDLYTVDDLKVRYR